MIEKLDDNSEYIHNIAESKHQGQQNYIELLNQENTRVIEIPNIINEAKKDIDYNNRTNMNMTIKASKKTLIENIPEIIFIKLENEFSYPNKIFSDGFSSLYFSTES
jgi:hypothetical protein